MHSIYLFLLLFIQAQLLGAATLDDCHKQYTALVRGHSDQRLASAPPLPTTPAERAEYGQFLQRWLGIAPEEVTYERAFPMVVRGKPESNFVPQVDVSKAVLDPETYDTVIVGSGPAGLTAGTYLTEAGKKILILEQGRELGGLAVGDVRRGVQFGRGGAYFSAVDGDLYKIYQHLGLGRFRKQNAIAEHIDSYFWNGKYYHGLWESQEALNELPASFSVFKLLLERAVEDGSVASTPFRGRRMAQLDSMSMSEWVRKMPEELRRLAASGNREAKALLARFDADPKVNRAAPMEDVLGLLQLYGRSALGDHPDRVSAQAFASFYSSELETRFSSNLGAGAVSEAAIQRLRRHSDLVQVKTEAPVARVENVRGGVSVVYVENGQVRRVNARHAVLSTPLNVSRQVLHGYEQAAPESYRAATSLEHRNYMVINVHVKGHPWKSTYDLWVRDDATYSQNSITDIIDGRWMDYGPTQSAGHHPGTVTAVRPDDRGVITIYKPLPTEHVGSGFGAAESTQLAEGAIHEMRQILARAQRAAGEPVEDIQVLAAEVNRWPYSIHLAEPGYLTRSRVLERPIGRVFLANNNMGVPSVEEAAFRGYEAARRILARDPARSPRNPTRPAQ